MDEYYGVPVRLLSREHTVCVLSYHADSPCAPDRANVAQRELCTGITPASVGQTPPEFFRASRLQASATMHPRAVHDGRITAIRQPVPR